MFGEGTSPNFRALTNRRIGLKFGTEKLEVMAHKVTSRNRQATVKNSKNFSKMTQKMAIFLG